MTTKRETLVLSNRGQITLPATLRKRFGLHSGDALTIEERDGELVLKPAVVLEVDIYTDADIAQWDKEDELTASQREAILKYLGDGGLNRVFLDANVLFTAAHNPQGKAAFVIELGIRGQWRLYTSALAVEEARRNLEIKFPSSLERFRHFLQGLVILSMHPDHPAPVVLPDKDRPIFQAAVECRATHLLTGDIKDFGPLMNKPELTGGIIIQTVAHFLEKLQTPAS